jgi:hypothetical protein
MCLVGVECVQEFSRSLQFSLQSEAGSLWAPQGAKKPPSDNPGGLYFVVAAVCQSLLLEAYEPGFVRGDQIEKNESPL